MSTPDPEAETDELPTAYRQAIRAEVRDVLRKTGKQVAEEQGWTKRDVIQAGGFVALGAMFGGGGLLAATNPVQAAASGQVGTASSAVSTGFFEALNAGDNSQLTSWGSGFDTHAATKSSAYSTSGEHFIDVDTSAAGVTITLSTADAVLGHYIVLRQNGANDLTIDTEGGQNIDGSASLTLQHDGAMVILWSDGSNWFSNQLLDTVDAGTVLTNNMTFVRATRGTNSSSTTADTFINAFDGESKDVRGEFNASAQFTPDESGEYLITFSATFTGSTSGNDRLDGRVQDVDGSNEIAKQRADSASNAPIPSFNFIVNLTAGTTYELQVRNRTNSFVVNTSDTVGVIKRSIVA